MKQAEYNNNKDLISTIILHTNHQKIYPSKDRDHQSGLKSQIQCLKQTKKTNLDRD